MKTSKATATRDLQDLVANDIFKPIGGGGGEVHDMKSMFDFEISLSLITVFYILF